MQLTSNPEMNLDDRKLVNGLLERIIVLKDRFTDKTSIIAHKKMQEIPKEN